MSDPRQMGRLPALTVLLLVLALLLWWARKDAPRSAARAGASPAPAEVELDADR